MNDAYLSSIQRLREKLLQANPSAAPGGVPGGGVPGGAAGVPGAKPGAAAGATAGGPDLSRFRRNAVAAGVAPRGSEPGGTPAAGVPGGPSAGRPALFEDRPSPDHGRATHPAPASLLEGLNPQQRSAVIHEGSPLLVIAGAGSGKTRVLTTRIAYLIATGRATPFEILAITFTNKAAKEMQERLRTMLGPVAGRMWISTFHSACSRILRAEHATLGLSSSFTIYDSQDSLNLIKMVMKEERIESKTVTPKAVARAISDAKNELLTPSAYATKAHNRDQETIANIYSIYQRRLAAANSLDFDDLIGKVVELLTNYPHVLENYRRRFRHILVDEYQDTNHAQYRLVRLLTGTAADPIHGELTVVGDADQSIYAFRGATIRNIEEFEEDFTDATTILLEQNYRSTQKILSAANAVISHNAHRRKKNLWTAEGDGAKLTGYVADNQHDEAAYVAGQIDALRSQYAYRDFAVFYRTNAQSRALEETFIRAAIPYKVVGGTRFYERKEIKDAIAYLHVAVNPDDEVSARRIFNTPRRGLGAKTEETLAALAEMRGISFMAACRLALEPGSAAGVTGRAANSVRQFIDLFDNARRMYEDGAQPADLLTYLLEESGYEAALSASTDPQDETRLENLAELRSVALDFAVDYPDGTVDDFLERISLVSDSDQIPGKDDGEVTLMTVHTAKGLEFPVVFVTGLEDGTFPHMRALQGDSELDEERRLAYVALTRARAKLYVTRAASRASWGSPQNFPASRFLKEIPDTVIDWERTDEDVTVYDDDWDYGYSSGYSGYSGSSKYSGGSNYGGWSNGGARSGTASSTFTPKRLGAKPTGDDGRSLHRDAATEADLATLGEGALASFTSQRDKRTVDTHGFAVRERVVHKSFGKGTIIGFEGHDASTVAVVKFDTGATKRLMLRYKALSKLEGSTDE